MVESLNEMKGFGMIRETKPKSEQKRGISKSFTKPPIQKNREGRCNEGFHLARKAPSNGKTFGKCGKKNISKMYTNVPLGQTDPRCREADLYIRYNKPRLLKFCGKEL